MLFSYLSHIFLLLPRLLYFFFLWNQNYHLVFLMILIFSWTKTSLFSSVNDTKISSIWNATPKQAPRSHSIAVSHLQIIDDELHVEQTNKQTFLFYFIQCNSLSFMNEGRRSIKMRFRFRVKILRKLFIIFYYLFCWWEQWLWEEWLLSFVCDDLVMVFCEVGVKQLN